MQITLYVPIILDKKPDSERIIQNRIQKENLFVKLKNYFKNTEKAYAHTRLCV